MKKSFVIILILLVSTQINAQLIKKKSIDASIGLGYSFPNDQSDIYGSGFFMLGEYALSLASWIELRPYTGLILTNTNSDNNELNKADYKSTINAFLLGGKTRIIAPIPWVSPYIEIGIGMSVGSYKNLTLYTNINDNGIVLHIPWSLGLKIGRNHKFDISFSYFEHPSVEQYVGTLAFGWSFPLKK